MEGSRWGAQGREGQLGAVLGEGRDWNLVHRWRRGRPGTGGEALGCEKGRPRASHGLRHPWRPDGEETGTCQKVASIFSQKTRIEALC